MKKRFASLPALALVAFAALVLMLAPAAFACPTPTVQTATTCNASQQAGTNGTTMCYSGTNSGNYVPFSLAALLNGTETLPVQVHGQPTATYLIKNDTNNTNFTLTYTGAAPSGSTQAMQCNNTLSAGSCQITGAAGTAAELVNYGAPSGGWPSTIIAQFSYNDIPTGSNFDMTMPNFVGDGFTGSLSGACYGSCQVANSCSGSGTTTVTGRVYVPNGVDPLPNALVYIPNSVPDPIPAGVQCLTNGNEASGNPVTFTYSKYDGTFTLTGVPSGTNIPIVVQSGKWRMQGTISTVAACGTTVAPAWATTMPSTHVQGDIPKIAMVTGSVDAVECVLLRTGLNQSEFTDAGGTGQVTLFKADSSGGVTLDGGTTLESSLTHNLPLLNAYDMLMLACQGNPNDPNASGDMDNVLDWANRGGRVFATHYEYAWLYNSLNAANVTQTINGTTSTTPLDTAQGPKTAIAWHTGQASPTADPGDAVVNTTFTQGVTFSSWLENPLSNAGPYASTNSEGTPAHITLATLRLDQDGPGAGTPTQVWFNLTNNLTHGESATAAMQLTFNTPVGAGANNQCGKVLYNDYHVYNGTFSGQTFPSECPSGDMSDQEHALEYALFDLTNAVTPVTSGAQVTQAFVNSPSPAFTQGDAADQVTINVQNDGTLSLSSSLTLDGVLPTGITVNTSTFTSGGWTCTTSAGGTDFDCTRTTPLAAGALDAIVVPVQVASNAPTSPVGNLTDTISGGGLSANVTGSDPLPIIGKPVISWATPPSIVYGTPLSNQLDASATCGGATVPGTYTYTYGGNPISQGSGGTVLPAGNDTLSVTFTPTAPTSSCPVQTTTVVQVVNPAPLIVTADSFTRPYGTANPTLTDSIAGFVNGDTASSLTGSATLTTSAILTSPVGNYPITFATETLANPNYVISYVPGNLAVTQGAGAITWPSPAAINYGTPLSATQLDATATCGGVQVPGTYVYTPALGTVLNAGSYTLNVTFTPTDTTDCPVEHTTVPLTVNKDVLTVTADNKSMNYGAPVPTLTDGITGFVHGDTSAVVGGTATMATTGTSTSPAGAYPITFSTENLTATNYTFVYVPETLTISQGAGAITWPNPTAINYGTPLSATQLDAVATCGGVTVPGSYVYTPALGTVLNAGANQTLSVTFTPTDTTSCPVEHTTVPLTVNKNVLTVTAANKSMSYGSTVPTLTDTITGFVNGDTSAVVGGTATMATTGTSTSPAGAYPITFSTENLTATNYTFVYVPATLTISQATGAITWPNPAAINYGTPLSATQLDAAATCGGITVPGTYAYSPDFNTVLNAGSYTLNVTFTPTDTTSCPVEHTTVPLTVNKNLLTVTAANKSMNYGSTVPTLTDSITGFVNGDTSAVVGGTATMATTGTSTSPAGAYPITFSTENLTATNYNFNYVPGTLTINQATGAITWPSPVAINYGTPLSSTQLDAAATCNGVTVPGTYVYTPPLGTVLNAGANQTLSVTFTPTDTASCPVEHTTVPLTVNKAVLTVTADNKSMLYGSPVPALTDSITGFVHGDTSAVVGGTATLATTGTSSSNVGSYPITFSTENLTATNYTFNYVPATLTIGQLPQVITFNPSSPVKLGVPPITLTATGGPSGNPVTFTVVSGPGTLNGNVLTVTGGGAIVIAANQAGNANYAPAATVLGTILVEADCDTAPTEPVGTMSSTQTATLVIPADFTLGSISVGMLGAPGLDYAIAPGGTCTIGTAYHAGDVCTVNYTFDPSEPGTRLGNVILSDASGNVKAGIGINGTGTGPLVQFLPGTQTTVDSNIWFPEGVAVDAHGNVYATEVGGSQVVEENWNGTSYTPNTLINGGLNNPYGIAVDCKGNIYIADEDNNRIVKEIWTGFGYTPVTVDGTLKDPNGVAVDCAGNVYIADSGNSRVLKETWANGGYTPSTIANATTSNVWGPQGVAVDGQGVVYILNTGNGNVLKEVPSGSGYTESTVVTGLSNPLGIAVDGEGNLYISDTGTNRVLKETLIGGSYVQSVIPTTGLAGPWGLTVDGSGNIYVTDPHNDRIVKIDVSDPPALTFAPTVVGQTSSDSPRTVTVTNDGNTPLTFPVPASGNNPSITGNFILGSSGPSACTIVGSGASSAATLAVGASCTLSVSFTPASAGNLTGAVTLTDNNLNEAPGIQVIPLSGTGYIAGSTATTLVSSVNPSTTGQPVTFTATVSPISGSGTPTGAVQFSIDGVPAGSPVTVSGGTATYTTSSLTQGSHPVTASYTPASGSGFLASGPASLVQVVNKPTSSAAVVMSFSNTNWTYPGEANITVCVTPTTNVAATGSVQIMDGTTLLATVQLQGNGCAYWYITPGLSAGTHVLTAVYSGDSNNSGGVSAPATINVAYAPMTMEASCWNASFPYGADYQCNANTDSGPKSGYMTYSYDGGAPVHMTLNSNGATAWTIHLPPVGTHTILIAYPQQGNYVGATLPVNTFVVTPAPVIVALTPSSWYLSVGSSISFTATATSWSAGPPNATGSMAFYDGGTLLGTVPVNASGTATYSTSSLLAGMHNITATYSGGVNYGTGSTSITIQTAAAIPAFSQQSGVYPTPQTVALTTATPGGTIYYTTNGAVPTTASLKYSAAIKVTSSTTISAITVAKGYANSPVGQAKFTIAPPAATPTFSKAAGTFNSAQTVTISDATAGATIYYTVNGSTPTTSSTKYTGPITVSSTQTLQAIAVAANYANSAVASVKFTISLPAAAPAFSLAAGTYKGAQTLKITDSTSGATIYYTTNGTAPTTSSTKYTGPITVKSTQKLEAIAVANGYSNSAVASASYTIK